MLNALAERCDIDAECAQKSSGNRAVGSRAIDVKCSAIYERKRVAEAKLIALGVAAEVIVIVENEHATSLRCLGAIKMRRGKPTDAAAHDNEIIFFARVRARTCALAVTQCVRRLEGSGMAATHAGEQWRIVAGRILRRGVGRLYD